MYTSTPSFPKCIPEKSPIFLPVSKTCPSHSNILQQPKVGNLTQGTNNYAAAGTYFILGAPLAACQTKLETLHHLVLYSGHSEAPWSGWSSSRPAWSS